MRPISTAMTLTTMTAALLLAGAPAWAASGPVTKLGDLSIAQIWARPTAPQQENGAAYMVITNSGGTADELVSMSTPVVAMAGVHRSNVDASGVATMQDTPSLPVPAHGQTTLRPGSYHVMLMGLKAPLRKGTSFPLTLVFKHAGTTTIDVPVATLAPAADAGHEMGPMKMDHSGHGTGVSQ